MPSSKNKISEVWSYLKERFGVEKSDIEGMKIKEKSGDYWLVSEESKTDLETKTEGFRFIRTTGRGFKPTTYGLQYLGDKINENIVSLDKEELLKLLDREDMIPRKMDEEGYVALAFNEQIVGCGYYKDEKVSSRIPKGRSKELSKIISKSE